jgi:hypothetical protein
MLILLYTSRLALPLLPFHIIVRLKGYQGHRLHGHGFSERINLSLTPALLIPILPL